MFDLKVISSVLGQLEEERGVPQESVIEAIGAALATAYKKEFGKRDQIIRAQFDPESGDVQFEQIKVVVDNTRVYDPEKGEEKEDEDDGRVRFNPERHIPLEDARRIKKDAALDDEIAFPLEEKGDFGRIAAQTAKQVIIQKIREAERISVYNDYGAKENEIVSGTVQRLERGNMFVDLGRATGIMPYEEQIPGERFKQGERIRALLYNVEETPRGIYLRLTRSRPEFLQKLFEMEAPEITNGTVEIMAIAREAGSRTKIAVVAHDEYIDPVGACVGQRGVRVSTVSSELGGEKIDVIEWSDDITEFVAAALSPADVLEVELDEEEQRATVWVSPDQQSLAIGKGGQNARLAAKLTGWKIDVQSAGGEDQEEDQEKEIDEDTEEKKNIRDEASSETEKKEDTNEAEENTDDTEAVDTPEEDVSEDDEKQENK